MSEREPTTDAAPEPTPGNRKPRANFPNFRHGLRGSRFPDNLKYLKDGVDIFRASLERAVNEKFGEISVQHAGLIATAYRYEKHSVLCSRYLAAEFEKLSTEEKLRFSREAATASERRDKAIAMLRISDLEFDL